MMKHNTKAAMLVVLVAVLTIDKKSCFRFELSKRHGRL